jgi:hypothetical protein
VIRRRYRHYAAVLALAGMLLRGLLPAGFMLPDAAQARAGAPLVLCSGGALQADRGAGSAHDGAVHACAFALAAAPALAAAAPAPAFFAPAFAPAPASAAARVAARTTLLPPARGPPIHS